VRITRTIVHYFQELYLTLANRRRHDRLPIEGPVNATWKNQYGQLITHTCSGLNVSARGISLVSEEPAAISADAYLYSSTHRLKTYAAVRYCTRDRSGYRIGFQFRAEPAVWDGF
jgi:PilZ domain